MSGERLRPAGLRSLAYPLAATYHETSSIMQPTRQRSNKHRFPTTTRFAPPDYPRSSHDAAH